jgi:hypothetical protein
MKRLILWVLLFFFFYFFPEMVGGIKIEEPNFGVAFIMTLFAMMAVDWFGMVSSGRIDWNKHKKPLQK